MLAHDCAILGLSVDTAKLFYGDNPDYELWLVQVVEMVARTREREAEQNRHRTS